MAVFISALTPLCSCFKLKDIMEHFCCGAILHALMCMPVACMPASIPGLSASVPVHAC